VSSEYRRRPSEEREYKKELRTSRLWRSRDPGHDADHAWQGLRSGWLYYQVGDVAQRAVGLHGLTICVDVSGLDDPAESD
jgi:hypothetical protein